MSPSGGETMLVDQPITWSPEKSVPPMRKAKVAAKMPRGVERRKLPIRAGETVAIGKAAVGGEGMVQPLARAGRLGGKARPSAGCVRRGALPKARTGAPVAAARRGARAEWSDGHGSRGCAATRSPWAERGQDRGQMRGSGRGRGRSRQASVAPSSQVFVPAAGQGRGVGGAQARIGGSAVIGWRHSAVAFPSAGAGA